MDRERWIARYFLTALIAMAGLLVLMQHCRDSVIVECMHTGHKMEECKNI